MKFQFYPIDDQIEVTFRIRLISQTGTQPDTWTIPLEFFEQNYIVTGEKNGKNVYENFSFKNQNEKNKAKIYWGVVFGRPAWVVKSSIHQVEETKDKIDFDFSGSRSSLPDSFYDYSGSGDDLDEVKQIIQGWVVKRHKMKYFRKFKNTQKKIEIFI